MPEKKIKDGSLRQVNRTINGAVTPSSTIFDAVDLDGLKNSVDRINYDPDMPANSWVERYDASKEEWERIYPQGLKFKRRRPLGRW